MEVDLRGALMAERSRSNRLVAQLNRAAGQAATWRAAFAAADGAVPCLHSHQPVRPGRLRGGAFSTWRHVSRENDSPCAAVRAAAKGWAEVGPDDGLGPMSR